MAIVDINAPYAMSWLANTIYPFENGKKYNLFQFFWFAQKFPMVVLIGMEILLASGTTINL